MTLTQLSYIVAVDKYRHFATAAEKIYVTQPTLSMQIHKLEETLGVKIFDRSRTPVVPTEIGKRIISEAKQILRQARHIEDLARLGEDQMKGTFRIGVIPTVAPYLIPLFLHPFVEAWPDVELIFEEMLTPEVLDGVLDDTLDAGIIATPPESGQIHSEELFNEPFVGFLSAGHPLAERDRLSVEDLADQGIWLLTEGHCFHDQTRKLCKQIDREGSRPIRFESGNLETLKRLVEKGFGMTLMPWLAVNGFDPGCSTGVIKQFMPPVPSRCIRLVYGRQFLKQNIIRALAEEIRRQIPDPLKRDEEYMIVDG